MKCRKHQLNNLMAAGCCLLSFYSQAQNKVDTMQLSLPAAEKIMLQKSLPLVAARYNIDINEAYARQARLWDNPLLNTDQNIYDGGFFRHSNGNGQVYLQVTELLRTAGKRNKLAQLSADNATLGREQVDDLVRTLRYSLRSDLLEVNHLLEIKGLYDAEIEQVQQLVNGMNEEYKAGNVSMKDNMRLKALLFGLQHELVNMQSQLIPVQQEIKLLLQSSGSSFIKPALADHFGDLTLLQLPGRDSLYKAAEAGRPDMKLAETQILLQKHNLVYQQALAKPDINIGTEYDQRSSYATNYAGLSVSIPLNLFNRNQGNIKAAELAVKQQEISAGIQQSKLQNEVNAAVEKFHYFQKLNNREQNEFSREYDQLFQNMIKSYRDRQVGLLELVDFIDTYKDTKLKILEQHNNLVKAAEELNFSINKTIISLQ
jgi:cobalt-zinc-cadmium efflux system outer membrane protein